MGGRLPWYYWSLPGSVLVVGSLLKDPAQFLVLFYMCERFVLNG
jgi:hypothetical protein